MAKLRIYKLNEKDDCLGYGHETNERQPGFRAAVRHFPNAPDRYDHLAWDYVQIVTVASWKEFSCGNDGAQGWRHQKTGYTIPDYCRLQGGCPEIWTHNRRRQLEISDDSPVVDYVCRW
jgi:hypothetical protein